MSTPVLRSLREDDLPRRTSWLRHEQPRGTMPLVGEFDDQRSRTWFERIRHDQHRVDVVLQDEASPVAAGGLTGINHEVGHSELYAIVAPTARGKGYGGQLVAGLCDLAFSRLGLNRVYLWTYSTNERARLLYARCGFEEEGTLREHAIVGGVRVGRVAMGMLRSDWESLSELKAHSPVLDDSLRTETIS